jgi:hypothetical protein
MYIYVSIPVGATSVAQGYWISLPENEDFGTTHSLAVFLPQYMYGRRITAGRASSGFMGDVARMKASRCYKVFRRGTESVTFQVGIIPLLLGIAHGQLS